MKKAFEITRGTEPLNPSGFHMRFANGYTVSVQFAGHNYSDDGKTTAEVAAWNEHGEWYSPETWGGDSIKGWATPEAVAAFIFEVSKLP